MLSASSGATPLPLSSTRIVIALAFDSTRIDHTPAPVGPLGSGVDRIGDQVDENLFDLDPVRVDSRDRAHAFNLHFDARGRRLPPGKGR